MTRLFCRRHAPVPARPRPAAGCQPASSPVAHLCQSHNTWHFRHALPGLAEPCRAASGSVAHLIISHSARANAALADTAVLRHNLPVLCKDAKTF